MEGDSNNTDTDPVLIGMKAATVWKNAENSDKLGKEKAKMADSSIPVVQASEKVLQKPEKSEKQQQPQQQQQQQNVSNPWAQLDQLLTCAICLDRYRNPKLLPCQHTFCMEPCLDGLIDPIRRLIKCPECRAEHYVPYNGVQSYSTNLTLMRFLELHFLATGEEPEPQYLYQKCAVCEDKTEVFKCAHCDKNVCKDCKDAHADLLKREITRIMNQVRRGIARVSEAVSSIKKNSAQLQHNCESVKEEVENTMRRFTKELKDREAILLNEIDLFMQTELRCMRHLQENLEVEIRTVNTMCEEAESYMTDNTNLDDNELMNFKEQFIQSLEFLRNFNPDSDEFTKRLRFSLGSEPELLHQYISQFGELHVNSTHFNRHMSSAERMATKYLSDKQYDVLLGLRRESHHLEPGDTARRGYISDSEALSPRHSPRPLRREIENLRDSGSSYFRRPESPQDRYSGSSYLTKSYESLRNADFEAPGSSFSRRYGDYNSGYSSSRDRDVESTPGFSRTTRTLDRGGTTSDYENDSYSSIRSRLSRARGETSSDATVTSGSSASTRVADPPLRTWKSRQDLLESGNVNTAENAPVRSAHRAYTIDVSAIQDSNLRESDNESRTRLRSRQNSVEASSIEANRPTRWSVDNSNSGQITNTAESTRAARKSIGSRQSSIDSTINPVDQTRLTKTAENVSSESTRSWRRPRDSVQDATDSAPEQPTRSWRRHLGNQSDNETSSSTISGSEALKRWRRRAESQPDLTETISESRRSSRVEPEDSAESRLSRKDQTDLARRAGSSACEQAISRRRFKRYGDTRHKSDTRYDQPVTPETSKYSSDKEDFVVSYRSRRRSRSASRPSSQERDDDSTYESGALTRYRPRSHSGTFLLHSRSKSRECSPEDTTRVQATVSVPSREPVHVELSVNDGTLSAETFTLNWRVSENPRINYMNKGRMLFKIGTRGSDSGCFTWPRGVAVGPNNTIVVADSSNHRVCIFDMTGRFVKLFGSYGSNPGEFDCLAGIAVNRSGQYIISDRYNHRVQIFDPSGHFLHQFGQEGHGEGCFSYPWGICTDNMGFIYVCDKDNHRVQVFQSDGKLVGKFGTLGDKPGQFENPHYIAVSKTNRLVISDSSNHRIQVFDINGHHLFSFGSEGMSNGQFKFPRGVAVDDQGFIIVGDSGNNRIQIFKPDGSFLSSFGTWGCGNGEFKGLEGISVLPNDTIVVCDRENHRIQFF